MPVLPPLLHGVRNAARVISIPAGRRCCSAGVLCRSLSRGCCVCSAPQQEIRDLQGWSAPQHRWEPTDLTLPGAFGYNHIAGSPTSPRAGGQSQPQSYLQWQLAEVVLKGGKERASHLHQPPRRDQCRPKELKHLQA